MQTVTTAKRHRKERPVIEDNKFLQPALEPDDTHDSPKEISCLDYVLNSPAFNSKYKHDAVKYVLSMRLKRGLDTVPKQQTVLSTDRSLDKDSQFIYCLRVDQVKKDVGFDPYTLSMVSPAKAKLYSVYFTASIWTITEFHNGKICNVTEFCRWIWEKEVFLNISKLPFFRNFRVAKLFYHWKKHVNHLKIVKSKECLIRLLFVTNVCLQKALMYIHYMCDCCTNESTSRIALFAVDRKITYDLVDFLDIQDKQCLKASQQILSLRKTITKTILDACQKVCDDSEIDCLLNMRDEDLCDHHPPMHSKILQWRTILQYLARFTKQCDQIVLSLLQNLIIFGLKEFLQCFEIPSVLADRMYHEQVQELYLMRQQIQSKPNTTTVLSRYGPYENTDDTIPVAKFEKECFDLPIKSEGSLHSQLYEVPLKQTSEVIPLWKSELKCLRENGERIIKIFPSLEDFHSAISKTISGFYKAVSNFTSSASQDELLPYITQTKYDLVVDGTDFIAEWPNVMEMKHQNNRYEFTIKSLFSSDFKKSMELTEEYHCFVKMIDICDIMRVPAEDDHEHWPVNKFQHILAHFSDQVFAMRQMVPLLTVGVLDVSASNFRIDCLNYPLTVLEKIQAFLPSFAAYKCDEILLYCKNTIKRLQESPNEMHSFFLHLNLLDDVRSNLIALQKDVTYISKLFTTAQEFEISVTEHQFAIFKSLFPQITQLKNALLFAEAAKSENISSFNIELCKEINVLHHQVQDFHKRCKAFNLLDDEQYDFFEASVPMGIINQLLKEINDLKEIVIKLSEYQVKFSTVAGQRRLYCGISLNVTAVEVAEQFDDMESNLHFVFKLWSLISDWTDIKKIWINTPIESLNFNKIREYIQEIQKHTFSVKSALPMNNFVSKLSKDTEYFQQNLELVQYLVKSPVKARHWETILGSSSREVVNTNVLTIAMMINLKVFENTMNIESICNQACHEIALELLIKKVSNFWIGYHLHFLPTKSLFNKDTTFMGNLEVIKSEINCSLESLYSIESSPHIMAFKHAAVDWCKRLSCMNDTLDKWILCQHKYLDVNKVISTVAKSKTRRLKKVLHEADKVWRETMDAVYLTKTFMWSAISPGIWEGFQICNALLEQVLCNLNL